MNIYWNSFSLKGKNQGVCLVEAETKEEALLKTKELNIHPNNDDIYTTIIFDLKAQGLELNKLYNPDELFKSGFKQIKSTK